MKTKKDPIWKRQGFRTLYQYNKQKGRIKGELDPARLKDVLVELPIDAVVIPDLDGSYFITPKGEVFRYSTYRKHYIEIKSYTNCRSGYHQVQLYVTPKKRKLLYVHRLVLETFVGAAPDGFEADHKNADRSDNRVENLQWMEKGENIRKGQLKKGLSWRPYLTQIKADLDSNIKQVTIARKYNISPGAVYHIKTTK